MPSWNKGFTKFTHPSILKISRTMKRKKIDNFKKWREEMMQAGKIPRNYPPLPQSGELAEYIGVVLGDGNISKFPRTERIIISGNANNPGFIERYENLTRKLFLKKPTIEKISRRNAIRISLYQKCISRRLSIPTGSRAEFNFKIPSWINKSRPYLIRLLRGLFEAEGSLSIHKPTCTYNLQFSNKNQSLLKAVADSMKVMGYHPEMRKTATRLRRKMEVAKFQKLIKFREYK
jgi:hypothetical protein